MEEENKKGLCPADYLVHPSFRRASPHPEAREEASTYHATVDDFIALLWSRLSSVSQAKLNAQRHEAREALIALSRLAAPKPEGQDCNKLQSDIATEPRPAEPSCATCARIGACFKDADWCPNYLAVSAPEPRPAEEPVPAPSEEDDGGLLRDAIATIDKQRAEIIALRSQLARKDEEAELYRRQYDELSAWWRGERPDEEYVGNGHPLEERHARERAALREPAPVASHDASDTIRNARSVSHDNREPDGRKGE